MVNAKEMLQFKNTETAKPKTAYKVTASELSHFVDNEIELAELISDRKKQYENENSVNKTAAYIAIEELCQISSETLKKVMCGRTKITRTLLYKFTVGFKMDLDEANKYFELCGGPLTTKNPEDYICINALRDKDSIQQLVDDFEKHLNLKIGYNKIGWQGK